MEGPGEGVPRKGIKVTLVGLLYTHAVFLPSFRYLSFCYSNRKISECSLSGSSVGQWTLGGRGQI